MPPIQISGIRFGRCPLAARPASTPAVILSGIVTPIANMPPLLQVLTLLNLLRHFELVLRRVFLEGATFPAVLLSLVPMTGVGAVTLIFAAWFFRRRTS